MNDLELRVAVTVNDGSLNLHYEVSNPRDQDAYLLNRLFRSSPAPEMSPDIAYVDFLTDRHLVRVKKGIFAFPPGSSGPPVPIAPYVSPVRAGGRFTETIHLPLPLTAYSEYGLHLRNGPNVRIVEMSGIMLTLDWYWRDEGVSEKESSVFGQTVILPVGFKQMPAIHQLVSNAVAIRVPAAVPE